MDDQFVDQCRAGNERALTELFERYGTMMQKIAFRITRDREAQKEVFQDAAARIVRAVRGFDGRSDLATWVYRIAVNTALTHAVREKKLRSDKIPWDDEAALTGTVTENEGDHERDDLVRQVRALSLTMPQRYQEVMSLFYDAELSMQEIGERLHLSVAAVKAILFKARKQLIEKSRARGLMT